MSVLVGLQHVTRYRYDRPVALGPQVIRLRPAPHCRTAIRSYSLKVTPAEHFVNWQQDPHGNWLARFVFPERTTEFSIEVDLVADMAVINPFDFFVEPVARTIRSSIRANSTKSSRLISARSRRARGSRHISQSLPRERSRAPSISSSRSISGCSSEIRYLIRMEPGVQTPEETLTLASGSCRDSGVAAGAGAAASRPRGALRVRLPDPAEARPQGARRPRRHRRRLHRSARLGRGLSAGRRLDRTRSDIRACWPARATSRSRRRRTTAPPRRSPAASRPPRSNSPSR